MPAMRRLALGVLALLAPIVTHAQVLGGTTWGVQGAVNQSSLHGPAYAAWSNRMGFTLGAFVQQALGGTWSLRPELNYVAKGADYRQKGYISDKYIEIPVLVRAAAGRRSVRLFAEAGPALAFDNQCDVATIGDGETVSIDCGRFANPPKSIDYGMVFGAGIERRSGARAFSLGARYTIGMVDAFDHTDGRNRNLQMLVGWRL